MGLEVSRGYIGVRDDYMTLSQYPQAPLVQCKHHLLLGKPHTRGNGRMLESENVPGIRMFFFLLSHYSASSVQSLLGVRGEERRKNLSKHPSQDLCSSISARPGVYLNIPVV